MLPGKEYTPNDLVRIARRRIWFILVPFAVVAAGTAVVGRFLPDRYRSETLIQVVPQRVPETYVKSTVTTRIEDRLPSISQQILSRTQLEAVIQEFNLYEKERRTGIMEDIVQRMRDHDIIVQPVKGDVFRVSYTGTDPRVAMKVTERLGSLFIDQNLRDREQLAENTNQFLEAQLEDAKRRLVDHERKLEAYRNKHAGELPSQLDSNLQVVQNTQLQIQALNEALNRDRDRRLNVDRQLADLTAAEQASAVTPESAPAPAPGDGFSGATAAEQLESARRFYQAAQLKYKPSHPDMVRLRKQISELEKKADAEALARPVSAETAPPRRVSAADIQRQNRMSELRGELEQLDREIARKQENEKRLRATVAEYQRRIEAAPARESEMTELTRDYTTLQTLYTSLLGKQEEAHMSANLERRQAAEQFRILDAARLPERPISPNPTQLNLAGIAGGLLLALALVALLEYRDSTFRTDEEVASALSLPVLAVVPLMRSEVERRRAFKWRLFVGLGLGSTVAVCLAVVAYTFVR